MLQSPAPKGEIIYFNRLYALPSAPRNEAEHLMQDERDQKTFDLSRKFNAWALVWVGRDTSRQGEIALDVSSTGLTST